MKKTKMKVSGGQIFVTNNIDDNIKSIDYGIEYAISKKADIFITPEGSLSGYTHEFNQEKVKSALNEIVNKAQKGNLGLALGTCYYEKNNKCFNQIRFYNKNGTYLGFHSKILKCGTLEKKPEGEINHFHSSRLKTFNFHNVIIGGLVCNDLWASPLYTPMPDPHLSQKLSDMGAKIIFHSVNTGRGREGFRRNHWNLNESNLCMRAKAGNIWIVTVNNSYPPDKECGAPSGIINPNGEWIKKLKYKGEQFFNYEIEL